MSEEKTNPYSELLREHRRRCEPLFASTNWPQDPAVIKEIVALCFDYELRFRKLLATRQGTVQPDLESLYQRKADFDRRFFGRDEP